MTKAIRFTGFGGPEVVSYDDVERPQPGEGEVLVRVAAAGVNPVDWKAREGYLKGFIDFEPPFIPGMDFAGVVEAVGPGVADLSEGDEVFGSSQMTGSGSYAEYVVVPGDAVAFRPRSLDLTAAAALPVPGLTAWAGLLSPDGGDLQPGQTVLIHGAAGGVGVIAVQLAKWRGAKVIATASAGNAAFLKALGADVVVDYRTQKFEDVAKDVDVVFDLIGGEVGTRSWKVLRPGGILASAVGELPTETPEAEGKRGVVIFGRGGRELLSRIAELVDEGALKPVISETLPLSQARTALEKSKDGHVRGKILLIPGS